MEIELDLPTVHGIAAEESEIARKELSALGPVAAYERSRDRHDARLAGARDATTLACKAGCFWCCYFSVDVRPVELFAIVEFMAKNLSESERARIKNEAATNSALLASLSDDERIQRNVKCPFLGDGRCTIYAARPQTCRNYHATDATGCQQSFEQPDNMDIDPAFAPFTYQIGGTHVEAFSKALQAAGYDCDAYELNRALTAVLADPMARKRFESKGQPLPDMDGTEVPYEFIDAP